MTYMLKPAVRHPSLAKNAIGLTRRDYEGVMSTLCAGCGHDSVTAALILAFWELSVPPYRAVKLSGIGCSSKTPAYFLREAHGFNSVHGRMPAMATGANAANRDLLYVGISGDGDSLSIGLGQMCHAIRRNIRLLYVLENNGVYGLTKGQFSASADRASTSKRGEHSSFEPMDGCMLALSLGATFVARGFSGDKEQLVPILKAGLKHDGFAFVDVISPCVTFNDHNGSTKSYAYTRAHNHPAAEIEVPTADDEPVRFRRVEPDYDPTNRGAAYAYLSRCREQGEVVTGLLFVDPASRDLHDVNGTVARPLAEMPYEELVPGAAKLHELQKRFR